MRVRLSTLVSAAGLGLSLWLAILRIWQLPCWGGGCEAVIHSSYGKFLGIPVGWFGAVLWVGVFYFKEARSRIACLGLLAGGSVAFVLIQAFILHAFCPWCLAHAFATWAALGFWKSPPRPWGEFLGIAMAATVAVATAHFVPPAADPAALSRWMQGPDEGLSWLGQRAAGGPVLVLSLDCPACLDRLSGLTRFGFSGRSRGPSIYFKTDAANRVETAVFVAAVLTQPGDRREAFLGVSALALAHRDLMLTDPKGAAAVLRGLFPAASGREAEAAALLQRQAARLKAARVDATPLLIAGDGRTSTAFQLEDLFQPFRSSW